MILIYFLIFQIFLSNGFLLSHFSSKFSGKKNASSWYSAPNQLWRKVSDRAYFHKNGIVFLLGLFNGSVRQPLHIQMQSETGPGLAAWPGPCHQDKHFSSCFPVKWRENKRNSKFWPSESKSGLVIFFLTCFYLFIFLIWKNKK